MYYICVAYVEPNLVSLLAAQFLACFAQHRPGKNSHNRHRNALQYHHTIFVINNFLQFVFLAHEILIELFSPGDVLSRFCFFFRVSFQNFFKESAQVEAKSQ